MLCVRVCMLLLLADAVNLLAAHTTACFSVGCLDATPTRYVHMGQMNACTYIPPQQQLMVCMP